LYLIRFLQCTLLLILCLFSAALVIFCRVYLSSVCSANPLTFFILIALFIACENIFCTFSFTEKFSAHIKMFKFSARVRRIRLPRKLHKKLFIRTVLFCFCEIFSFSSRENNTLYSIWWVKCFN